MAEEYTYNELMKMQDEAIKRAKNMQERARQTIEKNGYFSPEEEKSPEKQEQAPSLESERAMILSILLLLGKETNDKVLMGALMYIMG